ncbi:MULTISPECIES: HypC/HybG/HupF family hydrogenase formation chaperone [Shewanella]|uniref:HypC/HybG/HupF family hydrogenase formation chaperone n=1 Tax=Shewanella TaxID=22 RepID=UPI001C661828|nr:MULTISPECIES: HypC/HybG/HupF family hydrogenase formation chaperone [Shewanella]QYJ84089.1 HypC/HybG/HupF family hydrogenase formation chaperone [Shewanella aegiceratis]QYJ88346.1 HypC/HybG/HupF family hydrogenase formation chaperone [Shewanella halotolerans]QYJ95489.1 HypC/HybG/HupF family hydrogenase formation chaperone [Shewanella spartinae]QYJ99294.1 HypC/HybG/HupF family hydrogenase formation chaperone [Shewanella alkalitolerans]
MCLSIPSRIVELHPEEQAVTVETLGVKRKVSSHLMEEPLALDDYVLIHIGFVMNKIDKADAEQSLALYQEIVAKMNEQEAQA